MKSFLLRFGTLISFVLTGFDRLRFRGEARPLNNVRGVDSYLYRQKVRYVDFPKHAEALTCTLCDQTEKQAKELDIPLRHLNSPKIDKEALALQLACEHPRADGGDGRIALLTCVEAGMGYRLRKNKDGRVYPVKEMIKCKHYYHYFQHPELGLCYVRLQSWFPFSVRVGMNGRQWLYQQLRKRGVTFAHQGNLLLSVADVALAQQLLDAQVHADYAKLLDQLVQPIQPLWNFMQASVRVPYYWMGEQTEWASDFMFNDPADLARWYARWLRHGIDTLQCQDVLRYLGKKNPKACAGEVKIDLRRRPEGTRLKFWYGTNSLKCYDKEGCAFRPETTINQPGPFKVFRRPENHPEAEPTWLPLRKGVADMERRAEVSQAANNRLLENLASVAETQTLGELLKPLGQATTVPGQRRVRALNPLTGPDSEMLRILGQGKYLLNGFRNRDLREELFGVTADPSQRTRQSAKVTRLLALLRGHGLIVKVPKTHRYQISAAGRRIISVLLTAFTADTTRLAASA